MSKEIVIVLDAGHKRDNRGGVLFNEGENNYRYSLILKKELEKYKGIKVLTTRGKMDDDPSLYKRATMHGRADLFISIHSNAAGDKVRGTEIINSYNSIDDSLAERHVKLIAETVGTPNRGVKYSYYHKKEQRQIWTDSRNPKMVDYYGVLRDNPSKIKYLIEYVFHTNREDSQAFLNHDKELARKEAEMIAKHFNLVKGGDQVGKYGKFYPKKQCNVYVRPNKTSEVVGAFKTKAFNIDDVIIGKKYLWAVTHDTGHKRYVCIADLSGGYGEVK